MGCIFNAGAQFCRHCSRCINKGLFGPPIGVLDSNAVHYDKRNGGEVWVG